MSTITPDAFRAAFPAFKSATRYPDPMIQLWATVAPKLLDAARWGDLYDLGQQLFIAHNLVLDGMATAEASRGGIVGFTKGPISAESGDKVSVSYASTALDPSYGHWNMSVYGIRYRSLVSLIGAGAVQVGPDVYAPGNGQGQGWAGPATGLWGY